ncbi:hypothetical protein [Sinomicrobium sp. M5D2P17]
MIHTDDTDPGFRYEGLARAAFNNCKKYNDPFKIAAQEIYGDFVPVPNLDGKKALSKVLVKIIIDYPETKYQDDLLQLEENIWVSKTQDDIIAIIDSTIDILGIIQNGD